MMRSNRKSDRRWHNGSDILQQPVWKQQEITLTSDVPLPENSKLEITGQVPTNFSPSAKGDYVEHLAICWLYEQGYAVFKNCSCVGDVDIIATKGDDTVKIDVKSLQYSEANKIWKCGNGRTLKQKEQKVVYMLYHPVHKTFVFSEKTTEPKNQ